MNDNYKVQRWCLQARQQMPLWMKVKYTEKRIKDFYNHYNGEVYVSFSGGKDSCVLLHIARKLHPEIPAVFIDTGLEYPEVRKQALETPNIVVVRPKKLFKQVIAEYGYPIVSKEVAQKIHEARTTKSDKLRDKRLNGDEKGNGKIPNKWQFLVDADFKVSHKCCDVLKKSPAKAYERHSGRAPIVGTMTAESKSRTVSYLRRGCNSFEENRSMSTPMAFWKDEDVWQYIKENNLSYAKVYDMGYERTGCMFCAFGAHLDDNPNRFQMMKHTHPAQHRYCIEQLGIGRILEHIGVEYK